MVPISAGGSTAPANHNPHWHFRGSIPHYDQPGQIQKKANELLGQKGQFWQKDYFDRAVRDEQHFKSAVEYIHNNPVKTGLVGVAEEWAFGSAVEWGRETEDS